jgi:excisionase family DNA binding protein
MRFAADKELRALGMAPEELPNSRRNPQTVAQMIAEPPPNIGGKIFYTVDEAAARLGMKVSWLYERTRRKAIPHRRLGKYVRFTEDDLRAISDAAATGTLE